MEVNRAAVNPLFLETLSLTRCFGEHVAVDSLTISVKRGEVFGLLGPNGAPKTTTLKMLTTLLPPTSGNARIAGFDIVRQPADVRRVIGYVPQLLSADGTLTGYENLLIFAKLHDIPREGVARANPLTYEVDALRTLMLTGGVSALGLGTDFSILLATVAVMIVIAGKLYPRVAT